MAKDEKRLMIQQVTTPDDNRTSIIPGNPEVIQIRMESNETVEVEPGAMCFMTPGVSMITSLGENNLVSGTIAGLKRVAGGENFFIKCVRVVPLTLTQVQCAQRVAAVGAGVGLLSRLGLPPAQGALSTAP